MVATHAVLEGAIQCWNAVSTLVHCTTHVVVVIGLCQSWGMVGTHAVSEGAIQCWNSVSTPVHCPTHVVRELSCLGTQMILEMGFWLVFFEL